MTQPEHICVVVLPIFCFLFVNSISEPGTLQVVGSQTSSLWIWFLAQNAQLPSFCPSNLRNDVKRWMIFFLITAFLMHKNVGFMKVIFIFICTAMTTPISAIHDIWKLGKKRGQIMVCFLWFAFWKRQTMSSQQAVLHGPDKKTNKFNRKVIKIPDLHH